MNKYRNNFIIIFSKNCGCKYTTIDFAAMVIVQKRTWLCCKNFVNRKLLSGNYQLS